MHTSWNFRTLSAVISTQHGRVLIVVANRRRFKSYLSIYKPSSLQSESTRRFTAGSMTIGRPQRRAVSPGHFAVASMPIFEPRPATGLAKAREWIGGASG